eukprot:8611178-Pyramimonas_sp.AAC.1
MAAHDSHTSCSDAWIGLLGSVLGSLAAGRAMNLHRMGLGAARRAHRNIVEKPTHLQFRLLQFLVGFFPGPGNA